MLGRKKKGKDFLQAWSNNSLISCLIVSFCVTLSQNLAPSCPLLKYIHLKHVLVSNEILYNDKKAGGEKGKKNPFPFRKTIFQTNADGVEGEREREREPKQKLLSMKWMTYYTTMTAETRKHLDLILIWTQSTKVQLNVSLQANEAHFLFTGLAK